MTNVLPSNRVLISLPSRSSRLGRETLIALFPWLVTPYLILLMASVVPDRTFRWTIFAIVLIMLIPALPSLLRLLKTLWTRKEVIIRWDDRSILECSRTPWKVVLRRYAIDSVRAVRVVLHQSHGDRRWSVQLDLLRNEWVSLGSSARSTEALDRAVQLAGVLNVQVQGSRSS